MKQVLFMLLMMSGFSAQAAGLYACGDLARDPYGLLFQEKGGAEGFLFARGASELNEGVQLRCTAPSDKAEQVCEPSVARSPSLEVTMRLGEAKAEIAAGAEKAVLRCGEIE